MSTIGRRRPRWLVPDHERYQFQAPPSPRPALLAIVGLLAFAVFGACVLAVLVRATSLVHPAAAVLSLVVGAAAITPLALAFRDRDGAALADPLVLAGWIFWLPMFCVGGVSLALGWTHPYFLDLLADPSAALAASELWGLVGFLAFAVGTEIPGIRRVGASIGARLPRGDWPAGAVRWPATALVVAGLAVSAYALATGGLGYEAGVRQEVSPLPAYLQTITLVGVALLWFDLVRTPSPSRTRLVLTVGAIGAAALAGSTLAESRATLATWVLVVLLVTALATVAIPTRLAGSVVAIAFVALVLGALIGSTYREVRAGVDTSATGVTRTDDARNGRLGDLGLTFERIADRGFDNVGYVRDRSVQRLEAPGALAVVVARHQELDGTDTAAGAPHVLESALGSFVPRVVWADKPASTDPGAISRLYFEFEANAFAITPMGDLLRDLGPVSVPIAMALMGLVLRLLHATLVESGPAAAGRVVAFVVLIVRAPSWWEGFYATFIADLVRAGLVVAAALALVHLWVRFAGGRTSELATASRTVGLPGDG